MQLHELSFPARYVEVAEPLLSARLGAHGYEELLREVGLSRQKLTDPFARIDGVALQRLLRAAVEHAFPDRPPAIQLLEDFTPARHGIEGLLSMTADTMGDALNVFLPFLPYVMPAFHVTRREAASYVEFTAELVADFGAYSSLMVEVFCGGFLHVLPFVADAKGGYEFRFVHAAQWPLHDYQGYFGRYVSFGASANLVRIDRRLLCAKLTTRSPSVHAQLRDQLDGRRAQVGVPRPHAERVRRQLERALLDGKSMELSAIARTLGTSARTLSRRLQDEATTLPELIRDVRLARAMQLLGEEHYNVAEVAARVRYRDPTSFSRAFKRAFGKSPSEQRRLR
ncbi:MAG TPA: helix-turn-helix domain-containing protein [Polyangiales bacterium]